jgi:hypothetical protein
VLRGFPYPVKQQTIIDLARCMVTGGVVERSTHAKRWPSNLGEPSSLLSGQ